MDWSRRLCVWAILLVLAGYTRFGSAYCLMTTCDTRPMPASCSGVRDERGCSSEGKRVSWGDRCITFSVQSQGTLRRNISAYQLEEQVAFAYLKWQSAKCANGAAPSVTVEPYPQSNCSEIGYNPDGPNRNLWVFRDDSWYSDDFAANAIALTSLTVDKATGTILDADVELNSFAYELLLGDAAATGTDLEGVILHEAGHVLGLGHSDWGTSTMASDDEEGSTEARTLEADDMRAVCALFPPDNANIRCNPSPVGGFSPECVEPTGCCSLAPGHKTSRSAFSMLGLAVALRIIRRYAKVAPSHPQR